MPVPNITGPTRTEVTTISAEVSGAAGIATWPAAAAAANNVSLAEVIRYIEDALVGTAGVVTWAAGAAPGNGVSISEGVRFISEAITDGAAFSQTVDPGGSARSSVELVLADIAAMLAGTAGITTFPAAAAAGNSVSLAEVLRYVQDQTTASGAVSQLKYATKTSTSPLTTGTIFTFAGSVLIESIIGRVTTVVQSQATTIKLSITPDALAAYDLCTTVDANAFAVGTLLSITGTAANAMAGTTAVGSKAPSQASPVVATCVTSGTITVTYGAASTGAIVWEVLWRPLNAAGSVTAA